MALMEQRRADRMEEEFLIPEEIPWYQTPFFERLILLALPPVGLVLAYRHPRRSLWRKVLITLLALLWLVPYAAMWIGALTVVGVIGLEFQGGFGPSIVRAPTRPNYAVVAEHRRRQREDAVAPQAAPASLAQLRPYWTDFRGPRRDGHYTEQPVLTDWPLNGPPPLTWRCRAAGAAGRS
ncbi:MAG: hypothetical protein HXY18_20165 [Bryobacteraceae bacterium]|nr:hypothetical protein [Bryobacteraceae bacterium]